ncbi:hypothetical protein B5S28_g4600 [[Candida] boidinii]|nr:hypothetical protein B5S28_g4600 [[Candida] boidinii]OWB64068.1 hypothetical protein B5S29_g5102 [[Candida] boidinii]
MAEQTKTSEKPDESNADSIKQIMTILNQLSIDVKQVKSDVIQVKSDVKRHDSEIDNLIKPNKLIDSTHKNIFASESTAKGLFSDNNTSASAFKSSSTGSNKDLKSTEKTNDEPLDKIEKVQDKAGDELNQDGNIKAAQLSALFAKLLTVDQRVSRISQNLENDHQKLKEYKEQSLRNDEQQKKISELQKTIDQQEKELKHTKTNLKNMTALNTGNEFLKNDNVTIKKQYESMKSRYDTLEIELRAKNASHKTETEKLKSTIKSLEDEKIKLNTEIKELKSNIDLLTEKLAPEISPRQVQRKFCTMFQQDMSQTLFLSYKEKSLPPLGRFTTSESDISKTINDYHADYPQLSKLRDVYEKVYSDIKKYMPDIIFDPEDSRLSNSSLSLSFMGMVGSKGDILHPNSSVMQTYDYLLDLQDTLIESRIRYSDWWMSVKFPEDSVKSNRLGTVDSLTTYDRWTCRIISLFIYITVDGPARNNPFTFPDFQSKEKK